MNKAEFITQKIKEGFNNKILLEQWEKFEAEWKNMGFPTDELEQRLIRRMNGFLVMLKKSGGQDYKGIIIGMQQTDFGARRQYQKAIEAYKQNPEETIKMGLTNTEGKPLIQSGFRKGELIELNNETIIYNGVFKENNEKSEWCLGTLVSRDINNIPELFSILNFRANKNTIKSSKENLVLSTNQLTSFSTEKKLNDKEVIEFLKQYYSAQMIDTKNLKVFIEQNKQNFNNYCIIKADVMDMRDDTRIKTDEITGKEIKKLNILNLIKDELTISCFCTPNLKFNFTEAAQELIIIGKPFLGIDKTTGEERISMNLYGYYAPEIWQLKNKKEYVIPEEIEIPKKIERNEDW